jgi:hypothetical protein
MRSPTDERWYHCNRYSMESVCSYRDGVIRHEPWCVAENAAVSYAFRALLDADHLNAGDHILLHALGVVWV